MLNDADGEHDEGNIWEAVLFAQGAHSQAKLYSSISIYLLTRIVGAILIGLLLGFLGRSAVLSGQVLYTVQLIAGLVMIFTAISFLPVKRLGFLPAVGGWGTFSKLIERVFGMKHQWIVVPLFFGLISFFIPCGATLAIEAQALSTGSPFYAALSLTVFVIGTIPAFLGMSILGKFLSMQLRPLFCIVTGESTSTNTPFTVTSPRMIKNIPLNK